MTLEDQARASSARRSISMGLKLNRIEPTLAGLDLVFSHLLSYFFSFLYFKLRISKIIVLTADYFGEIFKTITPRCKKEYFLNGLPEIACHIFLQYSLVVMFWPAR